MARPAATEVLKSYSTGDVARLFGVTAKTVKNWIDDGSIQGWLTPGGHSRVREGDLRKFAALRGFEMPENIDRKAVA